MPQQRSSGWNFAATVLDGPAEDESILVHSTDRTALTVGDRIYIRGAVEPAEASGGTLAYLAGIGVGGELYTSEVIIASRGEDPIAWLNGLRNETVKSIQDTLPGDAGALVAGFVTGDDGRLSRSSDDRFRAAGLSHLTAVSGSNLAMLMTMIGIVTYWRGRHGFTILVIGTVLLWGYAFFVGLPPPTLRAALLATAAAGGRAVGRPVDLVALTLLTVPMQIAMRPTDAYSVSFHLSVVASFGLAAGFSRSSRRDGRHAFSDLLAATTYAQLATLPIIIAVFGTAPMLSLVANIAATPFASFAFATGLVASAVFAVSSQLGTAFLIPAGWSAEIVLRIAELFGRPWSRIRVGEISDAWMIGLTLIASIFLLWTSGELASIRRGLRRRQGVAA
jgi:competence protein ComEC